MHLRELQAPRALYGAHRQHTVLTQGLLLGEVAVARARIWQLFLLHCFGKKRHVG